MKKRIAFMIVICLSFFMVFACSDEDSNSAYSDGRIQVEKTEFDIRRNEKTEIVLNCSGVEWDGWYVAPEVDIFENDCGLTATTSFIAGSKTIKLNLNATKQGVAKLILKYKRFKEFGGVNISGRATGIITINSKYTEATISSVQQLQAADFSVAMYYKLTADLDLGSVSFTIPENNGVIDGNGFSIKNYSLNVNQLKTQGFVGTNSGTIKNLVFSDAHVNVGGDRSHAGIVCGENRGLISNVEIESGSLMSNFNSYVGAIAGWNNGTIEDCVNNANVTGKSLVGGISGGGPGTVSSSTNSGTISGETKIGGITGESVESTEFCENSGNISGTTEIGGIAGYAKGKVYGSLNSGVIDARSHYVGGIVGNSTETLDIKSSENYGDVQTLAQYAGGIIGYGVALNISSCQNTGDVRSRGFSGGIAGRGQTFWGCKNNGQIISTGAFIENSISYIYLGGIAGQATSVNQCENNAPIFISISGLYIGGIAGRLAAASNSNHDYNVNKGAISFAAESVNDYVGGIFGYARNGNYFYNSNLGNIERQFVRGSSIIGFGEACTLAFNSNSGNLHLLLEQNEFVGSGTGNSIIYNINTGNLNRSEAD